MTEPKLDTRALLAQTDIGLIRRYQSGELATINQLIANHMDLLEAKSRGFMQAPIPFAAILGEAMRITAISAKKFDPESGVRFRTFLETNLRGLYRYVQGNKRVDRVPEHRLLQVRRYQTAKSLVQTRLNREPTGSEMAENLGWSLSDVEEMERALNQKSLADSDIDTGKTKDATQARYDETASFVYYSLTPKEQLIYDYSLGAHGKPQIDSVQELAKKLNTSTDDVYRVRKKIAGEITRYK